MAFIYSIGNGLSYEDVYTYHLEHDEVLSKEQLDHLIEEAAKVALRRAVRKDNAWLKTNGITREDVMEENNWDDYVVTVREDDVIDVLVEKFGFRWQEYEASTCMDDFTIFSKRFERKK